MTAVDVFVGNYTLIDSELYGLWLNGYSGEFMLLFLDFKFNFQIYIWMWSILASWVSLANNFETISFLTSDIASNSLILNHMRFLCINKLNAAFEQQKRASYVSDSMIHQQMPNQ